MTYALDLFQELMKIPKGKTTELLRSTSLIRFLRMPLEALIRYCTLWTKFKRIKEKNRTQHTLKIPLSVRRPSMSSLSSTHDHKHNILLVTPPLRSPSICLLLLIRCLRHRWFLISRVIPGLEPSLRPCMTSGASLTTICLEVAFHTLLGQMGLLRPGYSEFITPDLC